jgi:hypothetical protein
MQYADSLPHRANDPLRQQLWGLFCNTEQYFLTLPYTCQLVRVTEVPIGKAAFFDPEKRLIAIPFDETDRGAVFHEATHDLFHHSVFHSSHNPANKFPRGREQDAAYNEGWGEGFCDAVRWLMESAHLPDSQRLIDWPHELATDWRKQRGERILNHTGRSLVQFAAAWHELVAGYDGTADYLNRKIP